MSKKKKFILLILVCVLLFSVTACGRPANAPNYKKGSYTLLIYMCGSSLETKKGAATKNIAEILDMDLPENTTVVIQTGGAEKWRKYDIPSDKSNRYIVENKELKLVESNPAANMGNADTLSSFISFGLENYPAEQTSLIFWNHGGGSAAGVCMDEQNNNDLLTLSEISTAFQTAKPWCKFAFVGFDACLMANYETASILAPYADKMIASEELEPQSGWSYASLLGNLNDLTNTLNGYANKHKDTNYYTISLIDLTKIDKIKEVFSQVVDKVSSDEKYLMARATFNSQQFGSNSVEEGGSNLYDLGGVAKYLGIDYDLSDCVTYLNGEARSSATGLSFYFPIGNKSTLTSYSEGVTDAKYISFLNEYFSGSDSSEITFTNRGEVKDGKLSFAVAPGASDIICSVQYTLYRTDLEGLLNGNYELSGLGHDTDIIENDNTYEVNFVGNWVFLNGCQMNCQVVGELKNYTLYSSVIKINGEKCNLQFVFDKTKRELCMSGYSTLDENTGRLTELKDGDKITMLYDKFSDDLTTRNFIEGETFTYSAAKMPLTIEKLDDDCYIYQALITDIYGKQYVTNFAVVIMQDGVAEMIDVIDYNSNIDEG